MSLPISSASLSSADTLSREPCEDDSCHEEVEQTWYCVSCDCSFCSTCWDKQPAHKPKKRGADGYGHEKTDKLVFERYRDILEPSTNSEEQGRVHKDDEDNTWFGIGQSPAGHPIFEDYGLYATLMVESLSKSGTVRYPQLVSFIGQTGAGKSTVVKMLITHQDIKKNQTRKAQFPSPLPGSVNDNIPVSANVHLYADPDSFLTDTPILYADCEGLEGGESAPKAEAVKFQDRVLEPGTQPGCSLETKVRRSLQNKGHRVSRKISWATGDKEKAKREYAVTELYPRLLYTFSDVVVFVLRNTKTFESAVLTKLIGWASASFEKSVGQPALPHIVIALNATDGGIDAIQWDVREATKKLLADVESSIDKIPALQQHVDSWRTLGRVIKTTKDLLECYYSSVTVVRIPANGRPMLIDQQVGKLHTEIVDKCNQSHYKKRKVRMLSNSEDLQLYLQLAFDHFSQDLDTPFNFVEVALKTNPIPLDISGNILKLAVLIRDCRPSWKVVKIFERLSLMVASCIMLDIHRHRRLGTPSYLLDSYYMMYCEQAFNDFCDRYWRCSYSNRKGQCENVQFGHSTKGHQTAIGKVIATGDYDPSYNYNSDLRNWIQSLEREIEKIEQAKTSCRPNLNMDDITPTLHARNVRTFYHTIGLASNFISHYTCFCCLGEIPLHPLTCGHVLCSPCVRSYGKSKGSGLIEILECPICAREESGPQQTVIQFKPALAGVRVLCFDGGGIRGIVELEVLKAIEKALPADIPIRSFFDLIVGTSTGGIIALGIGVEKWSIDECILHFEKLCVTAFTARELHNTPILGTLATINHGCSKYRTKPLEKVLKETFSVSEQPLFGGKQDYSYSSVKTAVTSTKETGEKAVLLTNYNRSHRKDAEYWFERAEQPKNELNVWEAARATSAAPSFFKSFKSERNNRGYLDGALYHNNPVRVADLERRLIWPDTENSPPDILLSIGTSCNRAIGDETHQSSDSTNQFTISVPPKPSTKAEGSQTRIPKRERGPQPRKLFNILVNRVESILDTEETWRNFMSEATRGNQDNKSRYHRINPNILEEPPKLDETKKLAYLRQRTIRTMRDAALRNQIVGVARRLVATSFYLEVPSKPTSTQEVDSPVTGTDALPSYGTSLITIAQIKCKFPSESQEIRYLGEYFKNATTEKFTPRFIIGEKGSKTEPLEILITSNEITRMMNNALFKLEMAQIPVSNEYAVTTVSLSIAAEEAVPISGFPRTLIAREATKGSGGTQKAPRLRQHVLHPVNMRVTPSSQESRPSITGFPDIQQLPKEAKESIRRFIQERITALDERSEDVPVKMRLLRKASEETHNERYGPERNGPYGTVLHTASAIGNYWIVELQIKAGVDVTVVDDHGWTALMMAEAQGHTTCARLLSDHLEAIGTSLVRNPISPSGIIKSESSSLIQIGSNGLTATPGSWRYSLIREPVQVRANHPIPPDYSKFYFEVTMQKNGPEGIMGVGLCRPEAEVVGMPGWHPSSWGYHGDDGMKFNNSTTQGLRYSTKYNTNDIVGCGVNMQTGKLFFTKNGVNLAFANVRGTLYPMIGFCERDAQILVNFGASPFIYDLGAHDWGIEQTLPDVGTLNSPMLSRAEPSTTAELAS
ncbi:hypothetical protein JMJ35_001958 [Cladonia borealis]|uniref:phospholipase A2 n=1 Tax=Cladonia borealis TaxID=184061 RepID=A0AA39V7A3_9LECA|nr:hypothetical protein JMJ35_001958 [Cladonia borealis]